MGGVAKGRYELIRHSREGGCDLYAPEILPYEIGNALSAMVKRRQIQGGDITNIFGITRKIPVSLRKVDIRKALGIAIQHNLHAYDAYFLECCLALSSPLITLDARLSKAAIEMNIEILE